MSGLMKVMTCILGALAVVACLATIGIVGYSMTGAGNREKAQTAEPTVEAVAWDAEEPAVIVPTTAPVGEDVQEVSSVQPTQIPRPVADGDHVHDYKEEVILNATCYRAGRVLYRCECGDEYYVDIMSTGHVADDWEVTRKPTADQPGTRVQKCIYCDEILAQENVPFEDGTKGDGEKDDEPPHVHQFMAETEREPSCILAGLRKYTCSCGNFYTEMIPAPGHIATDWTVAEEPTTSYRGTEQRTCTECGVVLDSRPINKLTPSPSASASASSSQQTATTQPTANATASASAQPSSGNSGSQASPSASPTATPHSHEYRSYVLKQANCTEKGIRSFVCNCGSSYAESIERDLNNHTYHSAVIPATKYTAGYTVFTCTRCNYSYFDNYTPLITG